MGSIEKTDLPLKTYWELDLDYYEYVVYPFWAETV